MGGAFDLSQGIPARLVAGDAWGWRRDDMRAAYPAPDFALSYALQPVSGGAGQSVTPSDGGDFELIETADLPPGGWRWTLYVVRASDGARRTLATGGFDVVPDPAKAGDTRTPARRLLEAISARIEGRILKDADSYSIEGRSITRTPLDVLIRHRARLQREVAAEEARAAGRAPGLTFRKVRVTNG